MRSPSSLSRVISTASAVVPQLKSLRSNGEPYRRRSDVEKEIENALTKTPAEWEEMAKRRGEGYLSSEALVFLIRKTSSGDRDLFGRLILELSHRTIKTALRWAQGFDPHSIEEIVRKVDEDIVDVLLTEKPSPQSEFLEVAFGIAVKRRTLNIVEKARQDALSRRRHTNAEPIDDDDAMKGIRYEGPDPQEIIESLQDEARRPEMIRKACGAVKDPRHLEAAILRHVYDWPITDKDASKPTLARRFGKSGRQIQNWITEALEAMRSAIGDGR